MNLLFVFVVLINNFECTLFSLILLLPKHSHFRDLLKLHVVSIEDLLLNDSIFIAKKLA